MKSRQETLSKTSGALDRAAYVTERMKNTYVRTKEQAEQSQQTNADSPTGYAEDRVTANARDISSNTVDVLRNQGKRLEEKINQKIKNRIEQGGTPGPEQPGVKGQYTKAKQQEAAATKASASQYEPFAADSNTPDVASRGHDFARNGTGGRAERTVADNAGKGTKPGVRTVERSIKQSARASEKTIKTGAEEYCKDSGTQRQDGRTDFSRGH